MRTKRHLAALLAALAVVAPDSAGAQPRWSLEVMPGGALMTDDPPDGDFTFGLGGETSLAFRIAQQVAIYAGWDWHRFFDGTLPSGEAVDLQETGYAFGLRFEHPLGGLGSPALRVRVAATWNRIEVDFGEGSRRMPADLGWEIGGGLALPLDRRWTLTPSVRFRGTNADFDVRGETVAGSLGYAVAALGIALNF